METEKAKRKKRDIEKYGSDRERQREPDVNENV